MADHLIGWTRSCWRMHAFLLAGMILRVGSAAPLCCFDTCFRECSGYSSCNQFGASETQGCTCSIATGQTVLGVNSNGISFYSGSGMTVVTETPSNAFNCYSGGGLAFAIVSSTLFTIGSQSAKFLLGISLLAMAIKIAATSLVQCVYAAYMSGVAGIYSSRRFRMQERRETPTYVYQHIIVYFVFHSRL